MCRKTLLICFLISISGILILNANFAKDVTAKSLTSSEMSTKFGGRLGWNPKYICLSQDYGYQNCQDVNQNCISIYRNICIWNGNPASNCYEFEGEQFPCVGPHPDCLEFSIPLDCY